MYVVGGDRGKERTPPPLPIGPEDPLPAADRGARYRLPGGSCRAIVLPSDVLRTVRSACARAYPEEGCGLLLSERCDLGAPPGSAGGCTIREAIPTPNSSASDRRRSYRIAPELLRGAERHGADGRTVVGCFHSHPDGWASFSERDRAGAWPGMVYLVVGVAAAGSGSMRAFGIPEGGDHPAEFALRREPVRERLPSDRAPGSPP